MRKDLIMTLPSARVALFCILTALLSLPVSTAAARDVVLGPNDRYTLSDTNEWRFEVLTEAAGRFADVRVRPKQAQALSLTLYFLADPAPEGRFDTPAKMADTVTRNAESYLRQSLERRVTLTPISTRNSYGSLTVLTAAELQGLLGEFRHQTRGMVRLSSNAALGFTLLSNAVDSPEYRQALDYIYNFIPLPAPPKTESPKPVQPAAVPAPKPLSTAEPRIPSEPAKPATVAPAIPAAASPAPITQPTQPSPPQARPAPPTPRATGDKRDCLNLPTNAEIIRCVNLKR